MIKYMDETSELGKVFEGFDEPNENDPEQRKRASMFAKALKVKGRAIDIGYGTNLSVARGFIDSGLEAYILDKYLNPEFAAKFEGSRDGFGKRPELICEYESIKVLLGDVAEFELPQKFDLAVFWGAWSSAGNNFSIEETALNRHYSNNRELIGSPINETEIYLREKTTVLEKLVKHINPGGVIAIVSSNYARHGEGFDPERYNMEREDYLKALEYLKELGAKELYLVGDSKQKSLQFMRESFSDKITKLIKNARTPDGDIPLKAELRHGLSYFGDDFSRILAESKQTRSPIIRAKAAIARF